MLGIDIITVPAMMVLASADVTCRLPQAPVVRVMPQTNDISYEFDLDSAALARIRSDSVNPFAASIDTTTGGLRHERPEIRIEVRLGGLHYPARDLTCIWYEQVDVTITLNPQIYIASDFTGRACREAILEHEMKHVRVDRTIMNEYAGRLGREIEKTVNQTGALGPYTPSQAEIMQKRMTESVQAAMLSLESGLQQEMRDRQAEVDTKEEYLRVSNICRDELR